MSSDNTALQRHIPEHGYRMKDRNYLRATRQKYADHPEQWNQRLLTRKAERIGNTPRSSGARSVGAAAQERREFLRGSSRSKYTKGRNESVPRLSVMVISVILLLQAGDHGAAWNEPG